MRIHRFSSGSAASIFIRTMHPKENRMDPDRCHTLEARRLYALPDAAPVQVRCTQGSLWLTLDDDPRDIILEPGDSFETPGQRRALVYALEPSAFVTRTPRADSRAVRAAQPDESSPRWMRLKV
jgi:Protein of unknown function (DUF2917)